MLGVDRVYQVAAGEALQPLPKESRFGSSMMPFGEHGSFVMSGRRPLIKGFFCGVAFDRGCGHVFGLLMWVMTPVGPDVVR